MSQRFQPLRGTRGSFGYFYSELSLAQGPVGIGVTGANRLIDFIGYAWLLVLAEDRTLHLYRQTATVGEWVEVTTLLPPVFDNPLPEGARRASFAFDQSARVIIAYEFDGRVYVSRWSTTSNAYIAFDFAGVDPFVTFDATWSGDIQNSDVLAFYLDAGTRNKVMCRVQRDLFLVEYEMHDYGQPAVLDRVTRLPLRYQILVSDGAGEPIESGGGRVGLLSELYPYLASEEFSVVASGPTDGEYILAIIPYALAEGMSISAVGPDGGTYFPVILNVDGGTDQAFLATATGPTAGAYVVVVLNESIGPEQAFLATAVGPTAGAYILVVINHVNPPEVAFLASASGPTGGEYVAA